MASHIPAVILLEPVGKTIVVIVEIQVILDSIVVMIVTPNADDTILFVYVEDAIVVIVCVNTVR